MKHDIVVAFGCLGCLATQVFAEQRPFGREPSVLPGVVQAEDFDLGGEGSAYHTSVPINPEQAYRYTVVPVIASAESSEGYHVRLGRGDWLEYTVDIPQAGVYEFGARVQDVQTVALQHTLQVSVDGKDLSGPVRYSMRSEVAPWMNILRQPVILPAGTHTIRLTLTEANTLDYDTGRFVPFPVDVTRTADIDWIEFQPTSLLPNEVLASGWGDVGFLDGPGTTARFSDHLTGLDADGMGNVYLADAGNLRIRKISPDGMVSTLAGDGTAGSIDGPGVQARFFDLSAWGNGLVVSETGTIYVLDRQPGTNVIRSISMDGTVGTHYFEKAVTPTAQMSFQAIGARDSGELLLVRHVGYMMGYNNQCLELGSDLLPRELFLTQGSGSGGSYLQSLDSDSAGTVVYSTLDYGGYDRGQVRQRTSPGTDIAVWGTPYNWGYGMYIPDVAVDRDGNLLFIADVLEGRQLLSLEAATVARPLYKPPYLGSLLAVDDTGTSYVMAGQQLIRLNNEAGFGLALISDGGGTVNPDPWGEILPPGASVQVTAQPLQGWSFLSWSVDHWGTAPTLDLVMTNHLTIKAEFGTAIETPATNGLVLREPDLDLYPYNTLLTLKAQPDPGFEFVRWTNGSTNAIQEFYVFEPVNLAPVFAAVPRYTVTASVLGGVGGTVVRRPDQPDYYRDTLVRLSARPVPGYVFQVWLDGNTENPRTLSVQSNTALFAVFEPGDGTAPAFTSAPPPAITKGSGESLILTATATGSAPLDFQWYHDDEALPGANDARLVLTNLQAGAEGTYRVIVDNGLGSASAETELTIVASARLEPMSIDDHLRFWLNLSGEQGLVFQVDRSADLANWLPLTTLTNATGNTLFSHTVEDWPFQHFYRADPVTAP